jgi:competence protein ComGC
MKTNFLSLCFIVVFSCQLLAIEALPNLTAKHGGIVKKTSNAILEVVRDKEHTSIYITGHDHKNITDKQLSISAIAQIDGKQYPLQLSFANNHYSVNPANSYLRKEKNFVLMLTINFSGTVDRASFNLLNK